MHLHVFHLSKTNHGVVLLQLSLSANIEPCSMSYRDKDINAYHFGPKIAYIMYVATEKLANEKLLQKICCNSHSHDSNKMFSHF